MFATRISQSFIIKLAAACTHRCTYCYWFRDQQVNQLPSIMPRAVQEQLVARVEEYLHEQGLKELGLYFHGGEPLLFGKKGLRRLVEEFRAVARRTGATLRFGVTTNGVLIDDSYAALLRELDINVSLSLDGPKSVHDHTRVDIRGRGTYDRTVAALRILQKHHCRTSVLAVMNPDSSPVEILRHFADELNINSFDILIPYCNHDDKENGLYRSISGYLNELFDVWYEEYSERVRIRLLNSLVGLLMSKNTLGGNIGFGQMNIFSINTNGQYEPHDGLRISGSSSVETAMGLTSHRISDILRNELWQGIVKASVNLPVVCQQCKYRPVCGGGNIINRYDSTNGYDNPNVYCEDFKSIIDHAFLKILPDLNFEVHA